MRSGSAVLPDSAFWNARRVFVTGHTGFKGSWLVSWLRSLGADVMGLSLPSPVSDPSLWEQLAINDVLDVRADVLVSEAWAGQVRAFSPQIVLHLAAQPLVSVGWTDPAQTFATNVLGTVRVLEMAGALPDLLATLIVTTDKVYDSRQPGPHRESDALGGRDPYSASKAAAELVVQAWPAGRPRATARAGNVIGGGDWARDRLLPDLVRAWASGRAPVLRRPSAVRPWQHVLEPIRGYLLYVEALVAGRGVPSALNFGPADLQAVSVAEVVEFAADDLRQRGAKVPDPLWKTCETPQYVEADELTLDSTSAREELGWLATLDWREAVHMTLEWYAAAAAGEPIRELVRRQVQTYAAAVAAA